MTTVIGSHAVHINEYVGMKTATEYLAAGGIVMTDPFIRITTSHVIMAILGDQELASESDHADFMVGAGDRLLIDIRDRPSSTRLHAL